MRGDLDKKVRELVLSIKRRQFGRNIEAVTRSQRAEEVKFWQFVLPHVHEIQNAIADWYVIHVEENQRIHLRVPGGVGAITTLNVSFANPGTLTLSFSHELGTQRWTLRSGEGIKWRNDEEELHIEAVAEQALTWFLDVSMEHMEKNNMIER